MGLLNKLNWLRSILGDAKFHWWESITLFFHCRRTFKNPRRAERDEDRQVRFFRSSHSNQVYLHRTRVGCISRLTHANTTMSTQKADISVCSSSSERTSSRLSKRFRPSVRCHHTDKNTENQCSADGFMECVHCDEICCLQHITEHQNELKQLRDQLVQVSWISELNGLLKVFSRKPARCFWNWLKCKWPTLEKNYRRISVFGNNECSSISNERIRNS